MHGGDGSVPRDGTRPGALLGVDVADHATAVVVALDGEIDIASAPVMRDALDRAVERLGGRRLVVDLRRVRFLGSAGLGVLAGVVEVVRTREAAPPAVVVGAGPVERILRLGGMHEVVDLVGRVEDVAAG